MSKLEDNGWMHKRLRAEKFAYIQGNPRWG